MNAIHSDCWLILLFVHMCVCVLFLLWCVCFNRIHYGSSKTNFRKSKYRMPFYLWYFRFNLFCYSNASIWELKGKWKLQFLKRKHEGLIGTRRPNNAATKTKPNKTKPSYVRFFCFCDCFESLIFGFVSVRYDLVSFSLILALNFFGLLVFIGLLRKQLNSLLNLERCNKNVLAISANISSHISDY